MDDTQDIYMKIMNIFRLPNGQIILGGIITNHPDLISSWTAELRLNDEVHQILLVDGEQIMKKVDQNNLLRVVTTKENRLLSDSEAQSGKWDLVFT